MNSVVSQYLEAALLRATPSSPLAAHSDALQCAACFKMTLFPNDLWSCVLKHNMEMGQVGQKQCTNTGNNF